MGCVKLLILKELRSIVLFNLINDLPFHRFVGKFGRKAFTSRSQKACVLLQLLGSKEEII